MKNMELPFENTQEMEEEKESATDVEECKKTEVITESTTAERKQEEVPETILEQEEAPETSQELEETPETIQEQEKAPETIQELQEKAPETIQELEEAPENIQELEETPETIQEKEEEPETILEPEESPPHAAEDQCEAPQAVQEKQKSILNLNNEVVKMRKEVKRVRALTVRKLTRQMGALKKKKGKDADIERNQRRAARLLEEIHAIKSLVPDLVTKTALNKTLNFEQVCKDPKATISDRAMTRIATHPQFNKKIEAIKAAVKAFKEERLQEGKPGGRIQTKTEKSKKQSPSTNPEKESDVVVNKTVSPIKSKNCETDKSAVKAFKEERSQEGKPGGRIQKKTEKTKKQPPASDPEKESGVVVNKTVSPIKSKIFETNIVKACPVKPLHSFPEEKEEPQVQQTEAQTDTNKIKGSVKNVRSKPLNKSEKDKNASTLLEVLPKPNMEPESDVELSESEEKEYFDDSTEERFHKQSSGESEESDDDFFMGKVNKFKKKKTKPVENKTVQKSSNMLQTNNVQSELNELESRLKSKVTSLNSVFCPSLGGSKNGKGAGKGNRKFAGQDKRKDGVSGNKDFSKQTKFQKPSEHSGSKNSNSYPREKTFGKEHKQFGGRGQAKEHMRPKDKRGGSMSAHQAPQQPLHPSWEASKKRKEQQGLILAFQGKKIKFDDD
ncbi:serum response factor-binding protein 1 [Eucyclogobius newberryi]|uniref:serum response factor-binding protein 1 n=1 Tax=Eucyclogobius newberryi TaxID=166745 RepID=UPI003B5B95CE